MKLGNSFEHTQIPQYHSIVLASFRNQMIMRVFSGEILIEKSRWDIAEFGWLHYMDDGV